MPDYLFPTTKPVDGEDLSDEHWTVKTILSLMWLSLEVCYNPDAREGHYSPNHSVHPGRENQ